MTVMFRCVFAKERGKKGRNGNPKKIIEALTEEERAMLVKKRGREDEAVKTASKKKKRGQSSSCHYVNSQPTNWGDNPSGVALSLMRLSLQKCNQNILQLVQDRPNSSAWVELAFGGGLRINSFVDDGIWCHITFRAKVLAIDSTSSAVGKGGPLLLFAELKRAHGKASTYEVISCHVMGTCDKIRMPMLMGCRACDIAPFQGSLNHPNREFNVGPPVVHVPKILMADVTTTGED